MLEQNQVSTPRVTKNKLTIAKKHCFVFWFFIAKKIPKKIISAKIISN